MTQRIFKAIPFYIGYFASSDGHIWRRMKGRPRHKNLKPVCTIFNEELGWLRKLLPTSGGKDNNYLRVHIENKSRSVHRIVHLTFHPHQNSELLQVNHINRNTFDNRIDNLEWVTNKENCQHRICTEKPNSYDEMRQSWLELEATLAAESDIYKAKEIGGQQIYNKEAILHELSSSSDSMQVIADRLGCSFRAVKHWQEKEKIKRPKILLMDKVLKVLEKEPNLTSKEIAELVGSLNTSVDAVLRKLRSKKVI